MATGLSEGSAATGTAAAPSPGLPASAERALSLLVAGFVAVVASAPVSDNSLLTHLATGRLQVEGGLPGDNPFLNTSTDFPVPSWWWSAALGRAEQLFGLAGVRLMTVFVAAVLGWSVVRCCRPLDHPGRPAGAALTQALPAVVVVALLVPFLNGRPHLAGFALLAGTLVVWRERRSPWILVALFAVWVNVHGTWLYGIGVLALAWLAEAIDDRGLHLERLRYAAAVLGGLLIGGIWYPERFRLVLLPTEQLGSPEAREAIKLYKEWQPVPASSSVLWVLAILVILAAFGVLRRRMPGAGLMVVALAVLGAGALRLAPVAAITLASVAAMGVASASSMPLPNGRIRTVMACLGALGLVVATANATTAPHEDLSRFPVEEVTWMQERGLVATDEVVVLHNDWVGNYLEYRFGERANAWIDDRPSVGTLMDYSKLRGLDPGWEEALARADPDVVLWQSADPLPDELAGRDEWVTALTTDGFRLLCHARIADRCRGPLGDS